MPVSCEHRPTIQRNAATKRNPDEVNEANDGRRSKEGSLRTNDPVCCVHNLCFLLEHEHDGSLHRDDAQRLIRRVENKRTSHQSNLPEHPALRPRPFQESDHIGTARRVI